MAETGEVKLVIKADVGPALAALAEVMAALAQVAVAVEKVRTDLRRLAELVPVNAVAEDTSEG